MESPAADAPRQSAADFIPESHLLAHSTARRLFDTQNLRVSREAVAGLQYAADVAITFFAFEFFRALKNAKKADQGDKEALLTRAIEKVLGESEQGAKARANTNLSADAFKGSLPFAPTHALVRAVGKAVADVDRVQRRVTLTGLRLVQEILEGAAEGAIVCSQTRSKKRSTVMERDLWQAFASNKFGPLGFRMRQNLSARLPESSRPSLKAHGYEATANARTRRKCLREALKAGMSKQHIAAMLGNGKRLMEFGSVENVSVQLKNVTEDIGWVDKSL